MIKAVIFDLDHTLYDRRKTVLAAAPVFRRRLAEFLRPDITDEVFSEAWLAAETNEENHVRLGYPGILDELIEKGMFAVPPTKEQYLAVFYPTLAEHIVMCPDVYDALRRLREQGHKIALLTNGYVKFQNLKLSYTELRDYMDLTMVSEEIGFSKPDGRAFLTACRRLGVRTDEAVYVGDQIYIDMCGARGAGLKTVWIPYVGTWPDDLTPPDRIIHTFAELPAAIKDL